MKLKQVALLVLGLFVSGQALGMPPIPGTPRAREQLLDRINQDIAQLERSLQSELRKFQDLSGKAEIPEELERLQQKIKEKQELANYIREAIEVYETAEEIGAGVSETPEVFAAGISETPEERRTAYYNLLKATDITENDKEIQRAKLLQQARSEGDEWVNRLSDPQEGFRQPSPSSSPSSSQPSSSSSPSSSSWITPQRGVLAGLLGLGYVYHKVPWTKNRIKRILKEHGKKFSDLDRAEKDLLMSASRARFNPAGAFFFQEAVLDMPTDFKLRDELWPILNHVYYGKKKVSQKQARELRELYDEAQELMEID